MAPTCMTDYFHDLFADTNIYLQQHLELVNYLVTFSSLIYDLIIPITILIWILFDRNITFPLTFSLIHILRFICIYIHITKVPDKIIWNDPGILPSLSVSYSIPTAFFYNGQIAILALSMFYLFSLNDCNIYIYIYRYIGKKNMAIYICFPLLIFQMMLGPILRVNYSIG